MDAVLSMHWADDNLGAKKAKALIGFDIHRSIPKKIFLLVWIKRCQEIAIVKPKTKKNHDRYARWWSKVLGKSD